MAIYVFFSHFFPHLKAEAFLKGYCLICRKLGHEPAQVGTIPGIEDC